MKKMLTKINKQNEKNFFSIKKKKGINKIFTQFKFSKTNKVNVQKITKQEDFPNSTDRQFKNKMQKNRKTVLIKKFRSK